MEVILMGIKVKLGENTIHINNKEDALNKWIAADPETATDRLVEAVKAAFFRENRRHLEISDDSLAVEIWGHIYFEKFVDYIDDLVKLKLVRKLVFPVRKICATIDCGEAGHDSNRWFWDLLAPFKSRIGKWLPGQPGDG